MSELHALLTSTEPLDDFDRNRLEHWLRVLKEDVEMFGPTAEDNLRMAAISRRLGPSRPLSRSTV